MLRLWTAFLLFMCLALAAGPALAQAAADPRCGDDRGVNRCAAEQHRRVLALFDARPIEAFRDAGDQVRRVFLVDGYGNDLIAIEFVRTAGQDPMVRVRFPRREGRLAAPALQVPVPKAAWDDLLYRSEHFDLRFAPREVSHETDIFIGSHCWLYTIESVDPPQGYAPARLRRKVGSACERGPGQLLAHDMVRTALGLLPHCGQLDPRHHRNEATILFVCRMLTGDRMAAAEVLNLAEPLRRAGAQHVALISGIFAYESRIDWNGRRNQGNRNGAAFWQSNIATPGGSADFYIESAHGETADRVRVRGTLADRGDPPQPRGIAPVEMIWTRLPGQVFQIEQVTVGAWRPR